MSAYMRRLQLMPALAIMLICLCQGLGAAQDMTEPVPQTAPRPLPSSVQVESDLRLELYFSSLTQGGIGLLRLSGADIISAQADFRHKEISFFSIDGDAWYALIAANLSSIPGTYPLLVTAERDTGAVRFQRRLLVTPGNFIAQNFALTGLAGQMARRASEDQAVSSILSAIKEFIPEPQWDARGFALPLNSELTSPFGAYRVLNGEFETRHLGWDQNAAEGTPVRALAAGVVNAAYKVPAAQFHIYGKFAVIDHGYSLFSNYAHLSDIYVESGQRVAAGQIIGLSGNTGRSSAPHLHWEVLLQGEWVDGAALIGLWLPG